jgi:hypothetical protein
MLENCRRLVGMLIRSSQVSSYIFVGSILTKKMELVRSFDGVVERILNDKSEKYNFIEVLVRWNEDVIEPIEPGTGMVNPTREKLKKKDYNPNPTKH